MTIRLLFDLGCYGVGLILGIRLLGKLTPEAARFGLGMTILSVAGNLAIWRLWAPEGSRVTLHTQASSLDSPSCLLADGSDLWDLMS